MRFVFILALSLTLLAPCAARAFTVTADGDTPAAQPAPPETKNVCARKSADGTLSDMQCPGFTGAEFICPEGFEKVEVPATDFPQKCGPYR